MPNTRKILIPFFDIDGLASYPDDPIYFNNMVKVIFMGVSYYLVDYSGSKPLESGVHSYADYLASMPDLNPAIITVENISVTVPNNTQVDGIYRLAKGAVFSVNAKVNLPDTAVGQELTIIIEKVVDAITKVDDARFLASVSNGVLSFNGSFDASGNWLISAQRMNEGLMRVNAPYRFEFVGLPADKPYIEFNVYGNVSA